MGVRNKQCEVSLNNVYNTYNNQQSRYLQRLKREEDRVKYDYKVMTFDLKKNMLEQQKRENPSLDTTIDEMSLKHATKYLTYNPDDCCYLQKANR